MNGIGRTTIAAPFVALLAAVAVAAPAVAKPKHHASSGLACLKGDWVSEGIVTSAFHGGAGTKLRITLSHYRSRTEFGIAHAEYDPSDPLYLKGVSGGYFKLTGDALGRFHYLGSGRYHFDSTLNDEEVTVFYDGKAVVGPEKVEGGGGFANVKCTSTRLTTSVKVPTEHGTRTAVESWKRT